MIFWPEDPELEMKFYDGNPANKDPRFEDIKSRLDYFKEELELPGVTRKSMWEEYRESNPDGYGYTQFCYHLKQYLIASRPSMDTIEEYPEVRTSQITGYTVVEPTEVYIYSVSQKTGSEFNWIITGGNIVSGQGSNAINVQWGTLGNGKISVFETDNNLCQGDTVSLEVEISTGFFSPSIEQIKIFPNPFSNKAIIQFPNSQSNNYDLVITDLTGKVVRIVSKITENNYELNKDGLPAGLYLIELRGPNIYRGKIIIEQPP